MPPLQTASAKKRTDVQHSHTCEDGVQSAPWRAGVIAVVCVDPHEASLNLGGEPVRLGEVLCPYARAQTVLARVREFYAFTIALIAVPVRHKTRHPFEE